MTREELQAIMMRASRILTPLSSAMGTIKAQQRRSEKTLSEAEFERHFETASNVAFMSLLVAKSIELGLTVEEIQRNIAEIHKRHMSIIQNGKPGGG